MGKKKNAGAKTAEIAEKEISIEEALESIEEAIGRLESDDISLEDSFEVYKQGMELVKFCSQKIDAVEKKIIMIHCEGANDEF